MNSLSTKCSPFVLFFAAIVTSLFSCLALALDNPLLGRWARGAETYCASDSIKFETGQALKIQSADGTPKQMIFKNVSYQINKDLVVVNFGEPHGYGLSADEKAVTFKVVDSKRIRLIGRRNKSQDFFKCP